MSIVAKPSPTFAAGTWRATTAPACCSACDRTPRETWSYRASCSTRMRPSAASARAPTARSTWPTSTAAPSIASCPRLIERAQRAQAGPAAATDDEVVEDLDIEQAARLTELGGDAQILSRWGRITARMVMGDDHRGRARAHRISEHLADPHRRSGEVAAVDGALGGDDVLCVEQQDAKLLPLQRSHGIDERLGHVGRRPDQPRVGERLTRHAQTELRGGCQPRDD